MNKNYNSTEDYMLDDIFWISPQSIKDDENTLNNIINYDDLELIGKLKLNDRFLFYK